MQIYIVGIWTDPFRYDPELISTHKSLSARSSRAEGAGQIAYVGDLNINSFEHVSSGLSRTVQSPVARLTDKILSVFGEQEINYLLDIGVLITLARYSTHIAGERI